MECQITNGIGVPISTAPQSKYQSVFTVHEKMSRDFPDLNFHEDSVIEWAGEAMVKIGSFPSYIEKSIMVPVENYQICLPCDAYNVISVLTESGVAIPQSTAINKSFEKISPYKNFVYSLNSSGTHLNFTFTGMNVRITYLGIPTDELGYPYVMRDHVEAIVYFCVWKVLNNSYIQGKTPKNVVDDIRLMWVSKCRDARGSQINEENVKKWSSIWANLVPRFSRIRNDYRGINVPW